MSKKKYVYVIDEDYDIFRKEADKEHDTDADIELYSPEQDKWVLIKRSDFDKMFKHYPFVGTEYYPSVSEETANRMAKSMKEYIQKNPVPVSWKRTVFKDFDI